MPHKRVDIPQDDIALRVLSGSQYKVLHYLINRADSRGVCYPGHDRIASETGFTRPTVQNAMAILNRRDLIRYIRRDGYDPVTKRQVPNVYQINPTYICLDPNFVAESRALWTSLTNQCRNDSVQSPLGRNQQPTSVNQYQYPTPVNQFQGTNTNNQRPSNTKLIQPPSNPLQTPEGEDRKAVQKKDALADEQPRKNNNQRNAQPEKEQSSAAREKYHNPEPINSNLPDPTHEALAFAIRELGISMRLARGFVVTYGVRRCEVALESVREMGQDVKSPAGLFRSIVQNGLADAFALAQQKMNRILRS